MQTQFVREGMNHYFVIDKVKYRGGDYEENLFRNQNIPFFMPCEIRQINGQASVYYRLTFRTSLEQALGNISFTPEKLNNIMRSIVGALEVCEDYLLLPDNIMWDTDKVFIDINTGMLKFVYYRTKQDEHHSLREFVMEILQQLDGRNEKGAVRLLQFYNILTEPECSIDKLKKFVDNRPDEKPDDLYEKEYYEEYNDKSGDGYHDINSWDMENANIEQSNEMERNGDKHIRKDTIVIKVIKGMMAAVSIIDIALLAGLIFNILTYEKTGFLFIGMAVLIILVIAYMHFEPEETPDEIMEQYKKDNDIKRYGEKISEDKQPENTDTMDSYGFGQGSDRSDLYMHRTEYRDEANAPDINGETVLLVDTDKEKLQLVKEDSPGRLCLEPMEKGKYESVHIGKNSVVIGSMTGSCNYLLSARGVSRLHAKVVYKDDGMYILDMNSTNGTYLNGELIQAGKEYKLEEGDMISIAAVQFYAVKEESDKENVYKYPA